MQEFQQRVIDEKNELDKKLNALAAFTQQSPIFLALPLDEKGRLRRQLIAMVRYSDILQERIMNFHSDTELAEAALRMTPEVQIGMQEQGAYAAYMQSLKRSVQKDQ